MLHECYNLTDFPLDLPQIPIQLQVHRSAKFRVCAMRETKIFFFSVTYFVPLYVFWIVLVWLPIRPANPLT